VRATSGRAGEPVVVAGEGTATVAYVKSVRMAWNGRPWGHHQLKLEGIQEAEKRAPVGLTRTWIFSILRSAMVGRRFVLVLGEPGGGDNNKRTAVDHSMSMEERKCTCKLLRERTNIAFREVSYAVDDEVEEGLRCILVVLRVIHASSHDAPTPIR
jgi:hypothetical protein